MTDNILRMQRSGAPQTLLENALDYAQDMDFLIMVYVDKDGTVNTEWSTLISKLKAIGAIEMLKQTLLEE